MTETTLGARVTELLAMRMDDPAAQRRIDELIADINAGRVTDNDGEEVADLRDAFSFLIGMLAWHHHQHRPPPTDAPASDETGDA